MTDPSRREALKEWAQHHNDCDMCRTSSPCPNCKRVCQHYEKPAAWCDVCARIFVVPPRSCTCGLNAALAALSPVEPAQAVEPQPVPEDPLGAQSPEWVVSNCYTLARREVNRLTKAGGDPVSLERWQHVLRICELCAPKSSILRWGFPTELTEVAATVSQEPAQARAETPGARWHWQTFTVAYWLEQGDNAEAWIACTREGFFAAQGGTKADARAALIRQLAAQLMLDGCEPKSSLPVDLRHHFDEGTETFVLAAPSALSVASSREQTGGAWQPIETAPKVNGEHFLVLFRDKWPDLAYYHAGTDCIYLEFTGGAPASQASHWMPLPAPPSSPATQKEHDQ